jgi:hypothetical protein
VSIFNYQHRWYSWISQYSRVTRFCIMLSPSFFLIFAWYFLCYKPVTNRINSLVVASQKSNKERIVFYELQNQILELEKELQLFAQDKETGYFSPYEKISNVLDQIQVVILEFQQSSVLPGKPVSISMKLLGTPDAILKILYTFTDQSLSFVIATFEIITAQKNNWTVNVQGQLFS